MRTFQTQYKIQESVLSYISQRCSNNRDTEEQKRVFNEIDGRNDGKITKRELVKAFKEINNESLASSEAHEIIDNAGSKGNGYIDYSEWLIASSKRRDLLSLEKLERAFDFFATLENG